MEQGYTPCSHSYHLPGGLRATASAAVVAVLAIVCALWCGPLQPAPDSSADRICQEVTWFRDNAVGFVVATPQHLDMFLATCKMEFAKLDEAPRERLLHLLEQGRLQDTLVSKVSPILPAKRVADDEATLNMSSGDTCAVPHRHPKNEHRAFGFTSLRARTGSIDEIADSFKRAEVVRFDARPLLPKWLIGASVEKIIAKLGTQAKEAPVLCSPYGMTRCDIPGPAKVTLIRGSCL